MIKCVNNWYWSSILDENTSFDQAGPSVSDYCLRHASSSCCSLIHLRHPNWNLTTFESEQFALCKGIWSSSVKLIPFGEKLEIQFSETFLNTFFIWDVGWKWWKWGVAFLIHDPEFDVQLRFSKLMFTIYSTRHRRTDHRLSHTPSKLWRAIFNSWAHPWGYSFRVVISIPLILVSVRTSLMLSLTYSNSSKPLYWTSSAHRPYLSILLSLKQEAMSTSISDDRRKNFCNLQNPFLGAAN